MSALPESTSTESIELTTDSDTADLVEAIEQLAAENRELRERQQDQAEEIAALESELEAVETELAETSAELEATRDTLERTEAELAETKDDLRSLQDDFTTTERRLDAVAGGLETSNRNVRDLRDRMEDIDQQVTDLQSDSDVGSGLEAVIETPLERIVAFSEDMAEAELHSNQQRARLVARDVREYAVKAKAGYVVSSSDIRTVLSALDESAHPETVSRVIEFLDRFGGEDVEVVKRRGERRVCFSEDLVERMVAVEDADLTPCVSGNPVGV
jgi:chromosome segregation ATPase